MALTDHGDAPSKSLFNEQIHVSVGILFQFHVSGLQEGIPRISGESLVPRWVQQVGVDRCPSKFLKHKS